MPGCWGDARVTQCMRGARALRRAASLLLVLASASACREEQQPVEQESGVVQTREGAVRGVVRDDGAVWEYRGIPYAAPPLAERRFRPPVPAGRWRGERRADQYGPVCPQLASNTGDICHDGASAGDVVGDEDCLTLNVLVPRAPLAADEKRPVIVWVHGGGFVSGCGRFGSPALAEQGDVVLVGINYRLGLPGFFSSTSVADAAGEGALANWGVLDMLRALEWVQANILAFGGDPDNVTIMGQSAGGVAVCALAASPLGKGLFQRVIVHSGHCDFTHSLEAQLALGDEVERALGCGGDDVDPLVCLHTLSARELVSRQAELTGQGLNAAETVTLDGHLLDASPLSTILERGAGGRSLLAGSTRDEIPVTDPGLIEAITTDYASTLVASAGALAARPDELLALYPEPAEPAERAAAFMTFLAETVFNCPALEAARAYAAAGPNAFLYEFSQGLSPAPPEVEALGAYHTLDLAYAFDDFQSLEYLGFSPSPADRDLARRMIAAWSSFARTGEPATYPPWPRLDAAERYYDWSHDDSSPQRSEYHGGRCDRLRELFAAMAGE